MRPALLAILVAVLIPGCVTTGDKLDPGNPVAVASCPETLPALTGDTFGDTATKLIEVAGIYFKCRRAAIGQE